MQSCTDELQPVISNYYAWEKHNHRYAWRINTNNPNAIYQTSHQNKKNPKYIFDALYWHLNITFHISLLIYQFLNTEVYKMVQCEPQFYTTNQQSPTAAIEKVKIILKW